MATLTCSTAPRGAPEWRIRPMVPSALRGAAAQPKEHIVRFYDDDSFLCSMVGRFLLEGHREGASLILLATEERRLGIEAVFEAGGVSVAAAKRLGRLIAADAAE